MSQVSRPMQIALLVVIAFAGLWFVALRPKPAADAGKPAAAPTAPGVTGLTGAVDKAHGAAATSDAANNRIEGEANGVGGAAPATQPSAAGASAHPKARASTPGHQTAARRRAAARQRARVRGRDTVKRRLATVRHALGSGKVLVIAFYNPASFTDKAVREEVGEVGVRRGRVVKVAAPIRELSRYPLITRQVQVVASPTVVIVDRRHHAQTITGFTDVHEIEQRVADALTVHRG